MTPLDVDGTAGDVETNRVPAEDRLCFLVGGPPSATIGVLLSVVRFMLRRPPFFAVSDATVPFLGCSLLLSF